MKDRYPQPHSLRKLFPGCSEYDIQRLHHGIKREGNIDYILERLAAENPLISENTKKYRRE